MKASIGKLCKTQASGLVAGYAKQRSNWLDFPTTETGGVSRGPVCTSR